MLIKANELDIPRELSVAFTGRRASKLPWRTDRDPRCIDFLKRLRSEILLRYSEGKRYFLSGMANGVDSYAAQLVIKLRKECPDIRLVCIFPDGINTSHRLYFHKNADYSIVIGDHYVDGCMRIRNHILVDNAAELIACYDGIPSGGTAQTLGFALNQGIKITVLSL